MAIQRCAINDITQDECNKTLRKCGCAYQWFVNVANNSYTGNLAVKKTQTIADTVMELWLDKLVDQEKQYNHSHLV